jgi:DNA-binding NarL/FixJ family response regulator
MRVLEAALLGVSGWVGRDEGPDIHLAALRAAARGEGYLPADPVRDQLAARLASADPAHGGVTRALSLRESDVLSCLANGLTRKEISEVLQLSPNTVRTYVRSILRKLHVHSAPAAVALASRELGSQTEPRRAPR